MKKIMYVVQALMLMSLLFASSYTILAPPPGIVDIAVTSVTPSTNAVSQGQILDINVTIENQGDNTAPAFDVTVYAGVIKIGDYQVKGAERPSPGEVLLIVFEWDTTAFPIGDFTISANATHLSGETDTADNTYVDGIVTVTIYDVAVTDVTTNINYVFVGQPVTITVWVANEGMVEASFNLTAYYDNMAIGTIEVIDLPRDTTTTRGFNWFTSKVAPGAYTIKANATTVPFELETDDNTKIDGTVTVMFREELTVGGGAGGGSFKVWVKVEDPY